MPIVVNYIVYYRRATIANHTAITKFEFQESILTASIHPCHRHGRTTRIHTPIIYPDSKVHGATMGPIWGRQDPGGPRGGPMNLVIWVHPCEKVIGIFFQHNSFTISFLLLVLIFIHNICEVVNIKSTDFCCISIIGYTSVTFWKRLLGKNLCHISLIYAGAKMALKHGEKDRYWCIV